MTNSSIPQRVQTPIFAGEEKIEWAEKEVPQPRAGQLLLQVRANALCGSERGQFYGGSSITPGHEAVGVVVAVGEDTSTRVGALGAVFLMDFCGECRSCRGGWTNQCLAKRADMGFNRDGGYGAYELINENIFFPVPDHMDVAEATMLLDVMGTGGHAIGRAQSARSDIESLLVAGAGPIGLSVLAMAKIIFGADFPVYISDVVPFRLQLAEQLGGIPIDLRRHSVSEGLKAAGANQVDAAIDTSGKSAARQACLEVLSQRGVLVCAGHGENLNLDVTRDLIATERAVLGSEYFRFDELPGNLALLQEHRSYLAPIITHRFPVSDIQQAFELFFSGQSGKVVVEQ